MNNNYVYGYVRVSTQQQDLIRQLDMLKKYNCTEIFTEKMSGIRVERPELNRLKDKVRDGDTLVIESFSRLGRSTKDLIELVEWFEEKGVKIISIKEDFDTHTPQGKLMLTVFQAFSQFERDLIAQRTKEGLESARARGRKGGRPKVKEKKIEKALNLYKSREYSISEIISMSGISQATLYRYIQKNKPANEKVLDPGKEKTVKLRMSIRIERNSKFVRGMKKTKEQIEQYLKAYYNMQIDVAGDYLFHVRYVTVSDLEKTIYDILGELNSTADDNNCFIESDVFCDELGLHW